MSTWSERRVVVTGAGGFIGSHLVEALVSSGASVKAFVHYNSAGTWGWLDGSPSVPHIEVVPGDVADPESVQRAVEGAEVVFHLAALIGIPYSYLAPASYLRTNVEGTLNVLQAARTHGVHRVIHTSTSEVYGSALSTPMPESHPLQAQSPYSASKISADQMAEAFARSFATTVVVVRPFNTYGPRQSARAIVPTIVSQVLTSDVVRLGNTSPTRDFTFVSDTVSGFIAAGEASDVDGETVNLGTGREVSISEIVDIVARLVGKDVIVAEETSRVRVDASEVTRLCADNSKASRLLDWSPGVELEEGLGTTIDWIRQHLGRYRPDLYAV